MCAANNELSSAYTFVLRSGCVSAVIAKSTDGTALLGAQLMFDRRHTFGGGLALYNAGGEIVGAIGLSGDESCTDHVIAWKVRHELRLDNVPKGVGPGKDNIIHDLVDDPKAGRQRSASGYGHPECSPTAKQIAKSLPKEFASSE